MKRQGNQSVFCISTAQTAFSLTALLLLSACASPGSAVFNVAEASKTYASWDRELQKSDIAVDTRYFKAASIVDRRGPIGYGIGVIDSRNPFERYMVSRHLSEETQMFLRTTAHWMFHGTNKPAYSQLRMGKGPLGLEDLRGLALTCSILKREQDSVEERLHSMEAGREQVVSEINTLFTGPARLVLASPIKRVLKEDLDRQFNFENRCDRVRLGVGIAVRLHREEVKGNGIPQECLCE